MSNKGPEHVLRDANLKASIWRNENERGTYFTTNLARTYRDEQGNYKDTHSFGANDLLRLAELARSAYNCINDLKRGPGFAKEAKQEESLQKTSREKFFEQRRQRSRGKEPSRRP